MREAGQSIITSLALDQPIDVQDLGYEALMGTFSGLIYSGIGSGVRRAFGRYSKAVSDRQAAQEAKARAEVREKLLGDAAKTKTAARMPEKLEDFMREMQTAEGDADTKKIYVDGRAIIDVFQAETDRQIDAIGEKLGIPREGREDFRQSVRLGLDIELDAPHLIATIASDKQYQQLKDHIKDDPTGLSMYEAIALDEESARRVEQTLADFRAEIDKIKNEGGAIGKFRRDLTDQLKSAMRPDLFGREGGQADLLSLLYAERQIRKASDLGISAEELVKPGTVTVARNGDTVEITIKKPDGTSTTLDSIRESDLDTQDAQQEFFHINPDVDLQREITPIVVKPMFEGETNISQIRKNYPEEVKAKVLEAFGDEGIENTDTGWKLGLTKNGGLKHMFNTRSKQQKGVKVGAEHFEVIAALPEIVKNAVLVESYDDQKGDASIEKMHRFFAAVQIGEKTYSVRLVAKEYRPGILGIEGDGSVSVKRLYDHTVEKEVAVGTSSPHRSDRDQNGTNWPASATKVIVQDLLTDVYAADPADMSDPNNPRPLQKYDDQFNDLSDRTDIERALEYLQTLYHGTGSLFDAFSLLKMSTGEGGQAFGWGAYLAEDRTVGEGYKLRVGSREGDIYLDGKLIPKIGNIDIPDDITENERYCIHQAIQDIFNEHLDLQAAINYNKRFEEAYRKRGMTEQADEYKSIIDILENRITIENVREKGYLYEVELPDDALILNWEKTIDEQPEAVRDKVYKLAEEVFMEDDIFSVERDGEFTYVRLGKLTGEEFYHKLESAGKEIGDFDDPIYAGRGNENARNASLALRRYGVVGHKFYDQFSRRNDTTTKTSNFVIYDPNVLTITSINGRPLTWREKLAAEVRSWAGRIDAMKSAKGERPRYMRVLEHTPLVFDLIDAELSSYPLDIETDKIFGNDKAGSKKIPGILKKHGIPESEIKKLPQYLAEPLAIFESGMPRQKNRGLVVLTEMKKENGAAVIVAVHIKKWNGEANNGKGERVNKIASIIPKDDPGDPKRPPKFGWWNEKTDHVGELLYFDDTKEASYELIRQASRSPAEDIQGSNTETIYVFGEKVNSEEETKTKIDERLNSPNVKKRSDLTALRAAKNFEAYQAARGKTSFYQEKTIISLFKKADRSTFLHEMGHVFLDELHSFAKMEGMNEGVVADWGIVADWLGISDVDDITKPKDEAEAARITDAHEKFAAGFEKYLMEGNAPTQELKSAFKRFKEWLIKIYKTVAGIRYKNSAGEWIDFEISDEIRGVFDRLLAVDDAIETEAAAARIGSGLEKISANAHELNIPEEMLDELDALYGETVDAARERLSALAMSDTAPDEQDAIRSRADELKSFVGPSVENMPVYRAIRAMQENESLRLDADEIADGFGSMILELMPEGIFADGHGMPADQAAKLYGFASASEMIRAVADSLPMEAEIEKRALELAMEERGSTTEENINDRASEEMLASDEAIDSVIAEAAILRDREREKILEENWHLENQHEEIEAAREDPIRREAVVEWICQNGGLPYWRIIQEDSRQGHEIADALKKRMQRETGRSPNGFWNMDKVAREDLSEFAFRVFDELSGTEDSLMSRTADEEASLGEKYTWERLYDILMGEDTPPLSRLEQEYQKGYADAREEERAKRKEAMDPRSEHLRTEEELSPQSRGQGQRSIGVDQDDRVPMPSDGRK